MIARVLSVTVVALALTGCARAPLAPASRHLLPIPADRVVSSFAVSPDGKWIAYAAEASDGVRRIHVSAADGSGPARELPETIAATTPFFSADGARIGYFSRGGLWQTALGGGVPQRIADAPFDSAGATWTTDDRIVFAPLADRGLMQVTASGGEAQVVTSLNKTDGELEHGWPHALPDGSIAFTVSQRGRDPHLEVLTRDGKRVRLRVPIFGQAQFVDTGHFVYSYLGNLMAVRFDADQLTTVDVPVAVTKGIQTTPGFGTLGKSGFAVSRSGTLVWLRASPDDVRSRLVRVLSDGRRERLGTAAAVFQSPKLSPDGRHLAVAVRSGVMTREVRILDARNPDTIVATISGGDNQSPAWMDDRRLTFGSNRDGAQRIYAATTGDTRPPSPLFDGNVGVARNPASWSRPPRVLALYEIDPVRGRDVLVYRVGDRIVPIAASPANERAPAVAYDGALIAFVSNATGRDEVYLGKLDEANSSPVQLTSTGGIEPAWSREGLYYREGERMIFRPRAGNGLDDPRPLFEGSYERDPGSNAAAYDVDPLGRYFVMLKSASNPRELRVVVNWSTELIGR